jgi:hypothetical protein
VVSFSEDVLFQRVARLARLSLFFQIFNIVLIVLYALAFAAYVLSEATTLVPQTNFIAVIVIILSTANFTILACKAVFRKVIKEFYDFLYNFTTAVQNEKQEKFSHVFDDLDRIRYLFWFYGFNPELAVGFWAIVFAGPAVLVAVKAITV